MAGIRSWGSSNTSRPWPNPDSLARRANVLWLDLPPPTGFSANDGVRNHTHLATYSTKRLAGTVSQFLQRWMQTGNHMWLLHNALYIAAHGDGMLAPSVALRILSDQNSGSARAASSLLLNLRGVAIGNAIIDPVTQFSSYPEYLHRNAVGGYLISLLSRAEQRRLIKSRSMCHRLLRRCAIDSRNCELALHICRPSAPAPEQNIPQGHSSQQHTRQALSFPALVGRQHDIRSTGTSRRHAALDEQATRFFNSSHVRNALMSASAAHHMRWRAASTSVLRSVRARWLRYHGATAVARLLESGVRVLVFAAEAEFDANWVGTLAWLRALRWSGQDAFLAANEHMALDFPGHTRAAAGLTYAKIMGGGGITPATLQLLHSWIINAQG